MKYNNKQLTKKDKIDKELERINKEIKKIKIHGGAFSCSSESVILLFCLNDFCKINSLMYLGISIIIY